MLVRIERRYRLSGVIHLPVVVVQVFRLFQTAKVMRLNWPPGGGDLCDRIYSTGTPPCRATNTTKNCADRISATAKKSTNSALNNVAESNSYLLPTGT